MVFIGFIVSYWPEIKLYLYIEERGPEGRNI